MVKSKNVMNNKALPCWIGVETNQRLISVCYFTSCRKKCSISSSCYNCISPSNNILKSQILSKSLQFLMFNCQQENSCRSKKKENFISEFYSNAVGRIYKSFWFQIKSKGLINYQMRIYSF